MNGICHQTHREQHQAVLGVASRPFGKRNPHGPLFAIRLFGGVRLACGQDDVALASRNARALLAVLALDRRSRFRDLLAADLWPDLPEQESGAALRQALWLLRAGIAKAGGDPTSFLECDKDRIGLASTVAIQLDVERFEQCLADRPARIEEAITLYAGDLAEGTNVESLSRERERLADLYEDALLEAGQRRLRSRDLVGAHQAVVRLLHRDPIREEAHTILIELYGLTGSRSQVARQYRRLQTILATELGVEPLPETQDAYQVAIRRASLHASR
jgi:DNA-binding SARP family transcriptional activator